MTTLSIPDDVLRAAGLSKEEALTEFACQLFKAGRLTLWQAARLAGLDRAGIEDALLARKIPIYRTSAEELAEELRTLRDMGA